MSTKILISEINRIGQIMYNNNQIIIIENLLLEVNGGTGLITKVAEKLKLFKTDVNLTSLLSRLERSGRNFEEKVTKFIERNINTPQGQDAIMQMFKDASELNTKFAEKFVDDYYKEFKTLLKNYKFPDAVRLIEYNYGVNVSRIFEERYMKSIEYLINTLTTKVKYSFKTFISSAKDKILPNYSKIKDRVESNYKQLLTETDGAKIIELEKSIKKDMDTLASVKSKFFTEINKNITAKINNGTRAEKAEYRKAQQILESIQKEFGEFGYSSTLNTISPESKVLSDAFKSSFTLESNIIKFIGSLRPAQWVKNFLKYFAEQLNKGKITEEVEEVVTKKNITAWKKIRNYAITATPRGLPPSKGLINLESPSAYDEILKIAGKWGAWRSFAYELILRGIKFQIYFAFLESIMFYIKMKKYDQYINNPCTNKVAEDMKNNNITTTDDYFEYITKNPKKTPICLSQLITKKDYETVAGIITWGYYRSQPQELDKWLGILINQFKNVSVVQSLSRLFPLKVWYDFLDTLTKPLRIWFATGDQTEYDNQLNSVRKNIEQAAKELEDIDTTQTPPTPVEPSPVEPSFSGDEKGLTDYLKTLNKNFMPGSYRPAEGDEPAEGLDTEDNIYYFEDNKWEMPTI